MGQLEVSLLELPDDTMNCRWLNALPTPRRKYVHKQAAVTYSSTEETVCVDCILMWH